MDLNRLPIDESALIDRIRRWVACESPSWDGAAVSRMTALAAGDLAEAGAAIRIETGRDGYGDCVHADFDPDDRRPGILVLGHLDTVHAIGSLAGPMPWRQADGFCHGPGAFDMKSGNCMALTALRQLRAAGVRGRLPVRFLLTSDEESGSPSTRALIEATALTEKYVLVPEGAQPDGKLVSGRFPSFRLRLWTRGKPSHALMQREIGRSALAAMARVILGIEAMNGGACAFTVTCMNAGVAVATVPVESYAELVVTARTPAELESAIAAIRALGGQDPGCTLEVRVKTARPLWVRSAADTALWQQAQALCRELGIAADVDTTFGGSDGNLTGAIGVPTLDGLGAIGHDAHQPTERIEVASLLPRTRLLAGLLATLA